MRISAIPRIRRGTNGNNQAVGYRTDDTSKSVSSSGMTEPKVINVDRMDGAVVVSFDDGVIALYSAALLRELLPQAQVFPEADEEPED